MASKSLKGGDNLNGALLAGRQAVIGYPSHFLSCSTTIEAIIFHNPRKVSIMSKSDSILMAGGWLSWVRANDVEIMSVLEKQATNLVNATSVLAESVNNYATSKEKNSILRNLEHEGDQLTHKLFTIIDKTFVTPLDKEDISELTSTIDQVLDATYGTSDRLVLFKIQKPSPYMQEFATLLSTASQEIYNAITELHKGKREDLIQHSKAISNCEHEGDSVYRIAIAELFETDDAIAIIKSKEVYETLESALDRCRDVADVIEDIALKYR